MGATTSPIAKSSAVAGGWLAPGAGGAMGGVMSGADWVRR